MIPPAERWNASPASDAVTWTLRLLQREHPNLLLIGSDAAIEATLAQIRPWLRVPIASWIPCENDCPVAPLRTMIVRDVETLTTTQQACLMNRITECGADLQIVSTTRTPLYVHVGRGAFQTSLYYRLNTIVLDV
jgi:hypothetical protein